MPKNLTPEALAVINDYLHLPIPGHDIACPYYNNRRGRVRGALRVMVGKGNVEDIVEETMILSLKEKTDLKNFTDEQLKQFLIDHRLGIDCSGLAYYILDAELMARQQAPLKSFLKYPNVKNPLRRLLIWLRPVENTMVATLADPANSISVTVRDAAPGDLIILKETGLAHDRDHVLIVDAIEGEANQPRIIHYTHSFQWTTDGKYNHGVKQGVIAVTRPTGSLLDQDWVENNERGEGNETFQHAGQARRIEIRRLLAIT